MQIPRSPCPCYFQRSVFTRAQSKALFWAFPFGPSLFGFPSSLSIAAFQQRQENPKTLDNTSATRNASGNLYSQIWCGSWNSTWNKTCSHPLLIPYLRKLNCAEFSSAVQLISRQDALQCRLKRLQRQPVFLGKAILFSFLHFHHTVPDGRVQCAQNSAFWLDKIILFVQKNVPRYRSVTPPFFFRRMLVMRLMICLFEIVFHFSREL